MKIIELILAALLLTVLSFSQTHLVALKCGRLIDGKSDRPLENVVVLVEGNLIKVVGKDVATPANAEVDTSPWRRIPSPGSQSRQNPRHRCRVHCGEGGSAHRDYGT